MEQKECPSNHEQIMAELSSIKKRMDDDMIMIKASYSDLEFRNRLWNLIKWIGFGASTGMVIKLYEFLSR